MNRRDAEAQRKDPISEAVIGFCIRIHRALGPGLLENAYEECLCYELSKAGLKFELQKPLPLAYVPVLVQGVKRLVNNYHQQAAEDFLVKNSFSL